jgi:hypothetical protein
MGGGEVMRGAMRENIESGAVKNQSAGRHLASHSHESTYIDKLQHLSSKRNGEKASTGKIILMKENQRLVQ